MGVYSLHRGNLFKVQKKGHRSSRTGKNFVYRSVCRAVSGYPQKGMVLQNIQENTNLDVIQSLHIQ